jgi:trehalose/maltose hydrolase-like predicted phosphorylase
VRWARGTGLLCLVVTAGTLASVAATASSGPLPLDGPGGTGVFVLTATSTGPGYAPTFTGNGELGVRVPPEGQGYEGGTVPTQSELAGFYAQAPGAVQQRANIPTWSTLTFADGGQVFGLTTGRTSDWRQSINLHTGIIATTARWTAPDGHVTDLSYAVLTDRARPDVGLVRLQVTPQWSGTATVTDTIDGSPAALSTEQGKGWTPADHGDWVSVRAEGTGIEAAVASQLGLSADVQPTPTEVDQDVDQSVGQQIAFPVADGQTYTFSKYVGVVTAAAGGNPVAGAQSQAQRAAAVGYGALVQANDARWAAVWSGRIDVVGDTRLATKVNASEFYLWSSTNDGIDWSISPAGLSSNAYNGHIFWDADTWMYPALLAQHPDLAAGMDAYREERLPAAETHARATGYQGARYPWESALDGTEQIPPPASLFSEGLYEQHITADVALAQWQYYLATGDTTWLARRGWPVISAAADFWVSRVTPGPHGTDAIDGVTGPDEENPDVDDEIYTDVAAKETLADAAAAARVLGHRVPAAWTRVAAGIVVPTGPAVSVQPEFTGYDGQLVKQADATLLPYPWQAAVPARIEQDDLNYYVPRTDPGGPSMSDSAASIDSAALATPGCSSYVYTLRSVQPYIGDDFQQFSETRTGGAFTFMTGIGGFLQEFLYGYSGLRWTADAVHLAPTLTGQVDGIVLHDLSWHGRRYTVAIGLRTTTVTLQSGPTLPVQTPAGLRHVSAGAPLTIPTRRPDRTATTDVVRCGAAVATSSWTWAPALAAVDGSPATDWQAVTLPATLRATVTGGTRTVSRATLRWGQMWPAAPSPTEPPPPGPVVTLRATSYTVAVSTDGQTWHTVASVSGRTTGTTDVLTFPAVPARYIEVTVTASTGTEAPMLDELTVTD